MKNTKIISRFFGAVLVLVMLVSSFAMLAVGSSASTLPEAMEATEVYFNGARDIVSENGVTFDDYDSSLGIRGYLNTYVGILPTLATETDISTRVTMKKQADGDYALNISGGGQVYVNGNVGNVESKEKYAANSLLLDLFNDPNFAKKFSISMELTANGTSGQVGNIAMTSDGDKTNLSTYYRGTSAITVNGSWLFKMTSANIPAYEYDGKAESGANYVKLGDKPAAGDDMYDKGYIYPNIGVTTLAAKDASDPFTAYAKHATNAGYDWSNSKTGACIIPEMMDMDGTGDALTYTLNKPFIVKFDIAKGTDGKAIVDVYIDGTKLWQTKYNMGGEGAWKNGIRFFDANCNIDIDNIKVEIADENPSHLHTGAWKDCERYVTFADGTNGAVVITEKCNKCGEVISSTYSNVAYTGVGSAGVVVNGGYKEGTNGSGIISTPTATRRIYFENISGAWDDIKQGKFSINFDLVDITSLTTETGGKSLVTWLVKDDGYNQFFRLFANGEIRLRNTDSMYIPVDSDFRLKVGGEYRFNVIVDPLNGRYDVYYDDLKDNEPVQYFGSESLKAMSAYNRMASGYPQVRFNDAGTSTCRVANFSVTSFVEASEHQHTVAYSGADEKGVVVGYDTLKPGLNCYCGEAVPQGGVTEVLVKTNNVYYGNATINNIPTEGEFWIATDVNVRSKAALAELEASNVLTLGELGIASDSLSAPATTQYALKISYVDDVKANVEVYVGGKLVSEHKGVELGDTLTLGSTESTDVRFNVTKIVKAGTGTPVLVSYNDATDDSLVPCYHEKGDSKVEFVTLPGNTYESGNIKAIKKLALYYSCPKCGENVIEEQGDVLGLSSASGSTLVLNENASTTAPVAANRVVSVSIDEIISDKGAYWIYMDFKSSFTQAQIDKINSRSGGSSILALRVPMVDISAKESGDPRYANVEDKHFWGGGATDTFAYLHFLRAFPDNRENGVGVRFYHGDSTNHFFLENGRTYRLAYRVEVSEEAVKYQVYIDDQFVYERIEASGAAYMALQADRGDRDLLLEKAASRPVVVRFTDQTWGSFEVSNFALVREGVDTHVHTDKWAESKGISVTRDTLEYRYECYCGEKVSGAQIDSIIHNDIPHLYENEELELALPEGEFWLAANYIVNDADTETAGAVIGINNGSETDVLAVINANNELWDKNGKVMDLDLPGAYSIAVRVIDETSYELYVNGYFVASYSGLDPITGDALVLATGDSKLTNIKVVTLGETETPLVPTYSVDETLRPCFHEINLVEVVGSNYDGSYVTICTACGELIDCAFDKVGPLEGFAPNDDGTYTLLPGKFGFLNLPAIAIGAEAAPYQIDFTLTLNEMIDPEQLVNNNGGRNIFNSDTVFNALIRQYPARDENGGYYPDRIELRSGNSNWGQYLDTMTVGDTKKISIIFYPATNEADIYIDGEYILTRTDAYEAIKTKFRFGDAQSANITLSDIKILGTGKVDPHTHTDRYFNEKEILSSYVFLEGNKVVYRYDCYCGKTVVCGINEIFLDEMAPHYVLGEKIEVLAPVNLSKDGYALVGRFSVRELPEAKADILTFTDYAAISVDADGYVYGFGTKTDFTVDTDKEYHSYAIVRNACGFYVLYIDGAYAGSFEDILGGYYYVAIGADDGVYHFDAMAVVALEEGGDLAYELDTTSHKHAFDPIGAELVFIDNNTAISIEYVCIICDCPAADGITKNLYDNEETEEIEAILPSVDNVEPYCRLVIDDVTNYTEDSFWFSVDVALKGTGKRNVQNVLGVGCTSVVTVDIDGTLKLADHSTVGKLTENFTNISVYVDVNGETPVAYVYVDGKYCSVIELDMEEKNIFVGNEDSIIDYKAAKFMEIDNGGALHIGDFACPDGMHWISYEDATTNYLDANSFKYIYKCSHCGKTIVEKAVKSFYDETIPHVYTYGGVDLTPNENESYLSWVIADVNVRNTSIGRFDGYKNLIGKNGKSLVLINDMGDLMLGDGTKLDVKLSGKDTYNVAVMCFYGYVESYTAGEEEIEPELYVIVYIDGVCVGGTTGSLKYNYVDETGFEGYEYFGDKAIENVRFYNIKSVALLAEGEEVKFDYKADISYIPCAHSHDAIFGEPKQLVLGEYPMLIYTCEKCGERVYDKYDTDRYDRTLNTNAGTDLVLGEDNSFHAKALGNYNRVLKGDASTMGKNAGGYWIMFDITPNSIRTNDIGGAGQGGPAPNNGNSGRNLMNFDGYNSVLRFYAIEDGNGGFVPGKVYVRSSNTLSSPIVATLVEGETTSFMVYIDAKSQSADIYVNGEFVASRTGVKNESHQIRFFDGPWGDYMIENFKFVGASSHVHTPIYSAQLGGEDIVVYGETTLTHRYTCYCGEVITAGIDKVLLDGIVDLTGITNETAVSADAIATPKTETYWISAKVSATGTTNVFSYGDEYMVEAVDGFYRIGGYDAEISEIKVSADYDVVSVNIDAVNDVYYVYINGKLVGTGYNVDFVPGENFNVKLGGGAAATFTNIKLVTLASGAEGEVEGLGCGKHEFNANKVKAVITDSGINFICKYCGETVVREVTIGNGGIHTNDGFTGATGGKIYPITTDEFNKIVNPENGGKFYFTFSLTPTALPSDYGDTGRSLFTWLPNTNEDYNSNVDNKERKYNIMFRLVKGADGNAELYLHDGGYKALDLAPTLALNATYKFIIEVDPATGDYLVYMSNVGDSKGVNELVYIGDGNVPIIKEEYKSYGYRISDNGSGSWTMADFKMFRPETVEDEYEGESGAVKELHVHTPLTDGKAVNKVTYGDGVLIHEFVCSTCGKQVVLDNVDHKLEGGAINLEGITASARVAVGKAMSKDADPYWFSVDISADVINYKYIVSANLNTGRSIVSLEGPDNSRIHLVRAFGHPYKDGEGYVDVDKDGFADGVIDLRVYDSKTATLIATIAQNEVVNLTCYVIPQSQKMFVYANGEWIVTRSNFGGFLGDLEVRFMDGGYGLFNFENITVARLTDLCLHEDAGTCAEGNTCVCADCGNVVETAHNIKVVTDKTGYWNIYTCDDCDYYYVLFADETLLKDKTFASDAELMNYLITNYPFVFVR